MIDSKLDTKNIRFEQVDKSQIENVGETVNSLLIKHRPLTIGVSLTIFFIGFFLDFMMKGDSFIFSILAIAIIIVIYKYIKKNVQKQFMKQFAIANGYTFSPNGSMDGQDGAIFKVGRSNIISNVIEGIYSGYNISFFNYSCLNSWWSRNRTRFLYTVFKLRLNSRMPNMRLRKKYFGLPIYDLMPNEPIFQSMPELRLESEDFNKHFSLRVESGYETQILEILTPDIMVDLLDKCKDFNLEIANDDLIIYINKTIGDYNDLYEFYNIALFFVEKLGPRLERMKPQIKTI